jgi:hypothetical protein
MEKKATLIVTNNVGVRALPRASGREEVNVNIALTEAKNAKMWFKFQESKGKKAIARL